MAAADNGRVVLRFSEFVSIGCGGADDEADEDAARAEIAAAAGLSAPLARISCRMCALTPVSGGGGGGDATNEDGAFAGTGDRDDEAVCAAGCARCDWCGDPGEKIPAPAPAPALVAALIWAAPLPRGHSLSSAPSAGTRLMARDESGRR